MVVWNEGKAPQMIMMVGVSYSGKSYRAKELAKSYDALIVSSDFIREELYGDASCQDNPKRVFRIVHQRIHDALAAGLNVIYDATNLNAQRRIDFLKSISSFNCQCGCVYMTADKETIETRMELRDRVVSWSVVEKQLAKLQPPTMDEGWNWISYE